MNINDHITKIARDHLGVETLQARNMDSLDFHEVAVWQVASALRAAYQAGQANASKRASTEKTPRRRP